MGASMQYLRWQHSGGFEPSTPCNLKRGVPQNFGAGSNPNRSTQHPPLCCTGARGLDAGLLSGAQWMVNTDSAIFPDIVIGSAGVCMQWRLGGL